MIEGERKCDHLEVNYNESRGCWGLALFYLWFLTVIASCAVVDLTEVLLAAVVVGRFNCLRSERRRRYIQPSLNEGKFD